MTNQRDLEELAREIIDSNDYMTLGTADRTGRPWVSPVWYAAAGYRSFYWVSSPDTTHSQNLAARPELGIVIFDSRAPVGEGQAVYMSAVATELVGEEVERGIGVFSRASVARGAREWTLEEVVSPARHRLYRATVRQHWVLDPSDRRVAVTLESMAVPCPLGCDRAGKAPQETDR